jgi:hypothetical protein
VIRRLFVFGDAEPLLIWVEFFSHEILAFVGNSES